MPRLVDKIEGYQSGMGYSLADFALLPGRPLEDESPDTANPANQQFNLDIQTPIGPNKIRLPIYWAANMESVCDQTNAYMLAREGIVPVIHQFMPREMKIEIARMFSEVSIDTKKFPHAAVRPDGRMFFVMATGFKNAAEDALALFQAGAPAVRMDTANGYTPAFGRAVKAARSEMDARKQELTALQKGSDQMKRVADSRYGDEGLLIGGNVGTAEGVDFLAKSGAHVVIVGIAPGTGCGTGTFLGIHVPQAAALIECAPVAEELGVDVISDGGARSQRHKGVALALRAKGVMAGSVWARTTNSPATKIEQDGVLRALYFGSASTYGRRMRAERYPDLYTFDPHDADEGHAGYMSVMGTTAEVAQNFRAGLFHQLWYTGTTDIDQFRELARVQVLSDSARRELDKEEVRQFSVYDGRERRGSTTVVDPRFIGAIRAVHAQLGRFLQ